MSTRSDTERENNWISVSGLEVDESYRFQVTALDSEGYQTPSEPKIYALKLRTGEYSKRVFRYCKDKKIRVLNGLKAKEPAPRRAVVTAQGAIVTALAAQ